MTRTQKTIAYQGEAGAFSHQAALAWYPNYEAIAFPTFDEAFEAVRTGMVDLGMIPVENSLAGRVSDVYHLLPEAGLSIVAEHFLPIELVLMALPGKLLGDLSSVASHPMALMQCRQSLMRLHLRPEATFDTAGAARRLKDNGPDHQGVIAPLLASEIYGLDILSRNMEDAQHNTTRFLVLSPMNARSSILVADFEGPAMTSFVFRVRNIPAALYKALGGFATNGVNLTKLESYFEQGSFAATSFFCDVEGRPEDAALQRAFEELSFFAAKLTYLGVYPQDPFRRSSSGAEA
jgi:prephenate dehydratase